MKESFETCERAVDMDGECVGEDWEIDNPTEVRFMKSKKGDSTECEMHLTLDNKMTVGTNPCKRTKMHCNNGGSKKRWQLRSRTALVSAC